MIIYNMSTEGFDFSRAQHFEWDDANRQKNWVKHRVEPRECEEMFFNKPLFVYADEKHSQKEKRYHALGATNGNRGLFVTFTVRGHALRVISARAQSRKERKWYETEAK